MLLDDAPVRSCLIFAVQADGYEITTIEGIAPAPGELSVIQDAFCEMHGLQCGYCTPGMIMSAIDIVNRHGGNLDEATVRHELEGNICRCTGYENIMRAMRSAAKAGATASAASAPAAQPATVGS